MWQEALAWSEAAAAGPNLPHPIPLHPHHRTLGQEQGPARGPWEASTLAGHRDSTRRSHTLSPSALSWPQLLSVSNPWHREETLALGSNEGGSLHPSVPNSPHPSGTEIHHMKCSQQRTCHLLMNDLQSYFTSPSLGKSPQTPQSGGNLDRTKEEPFSPRSHPTSPCPQRHTSSPAAKEGGAHATWGGGPRRVTGSDSRGLGLAQARVGRGMKG